MLALSDDGRELTVRCGVLRLNLELAAIEGLHSQDVINLLGRYCLPFNDAPNILTHDRWSDAALRIKRIVNSPWMQKRIPGASVQFMPAICIS